jgi:hypothetical protein
MKTGQENQLLFFKQLHCKEQTSRNKLNIENQEDPFTLSENLATRYVLTRK